MPAATFKDAFDHAVIGMALVNPEGQWLMVNPSLCGILGLTEDELFPLAFQDFTHPDDLEQDLASIGQLFAGEMFSYQAERRYRQRSGNYVWVLQSVSLVRDDDGLPLYFIFQIEDISRRKAAEAALVETHRQLTIRLEEMERRSTEMSLIGEMGELLQSCRTVPEAHRIVARMLGQLFPNEGGALCVMNATRDHLTAVVKWGHVQTDEYFVPDDCWSLRRSRINVVNDPGTDLACPHVLAATDPYLCVPLMAGREAQGLLHLVGRAGPYGEAATQLARTAGEQIALALANLKLHETLRNQSVRDGLTGLYNRRYLEEALERELNRANRASRPLALIILDIDHFKRFNDSFGHETGDAVLRAVASFVHDNLRRADISCRFGGEEFVLILPEAGLDDALAKAESLREGVERLDLRHDREPIGPITISLGVAAYPDHGGQMDALVKAADEALYRAKRDGRNRTQAALAAAMSPSETTLALDFEGSVDFSEPPPTLESTS